jgi:hypothetical protein
MRTLYFDIDGTLLTLEQGAAKSMLADGGFEFAVPPPTGDGRDILEWMARGFA